MTGRLEPPSSPLEDAAAGILTGLILIVLLLGFGLFLDSCVFG